MKKCMIILKAMAFTFVKIYVRHCRKFGGSYRCRGTFIELSKKWIDQLNAHHSKQSVFKPDALPNRPIHCNIMTVC